jgi:two-component system nitrate/nitrite response regulator NarL
MSRYRVVIVEDQTVFRQMLAELLIMDQFEVVAELAEGKNALATVEQLKPDLVIVDLMLPDVSGTSLIEALRDTHPETKLLVVTAQKRPQVVLEVFRLNVDGIVTKVASLDELREAAKRVCAGKKFYCDKTSELLRESAQRPSVSLSPREEQIVRLVAKGMSSKEIASALNISPKTVSNHRLRISQKLDINDIAGLTRYAISRGWVADDV